MYATTKPMLVCVCNVPPVRLRCTAYGFMTYRLCVQYVPHLRLWCTACVFMMHRMCVYNIPLCVHDVPTTCAFVMHGLWGCNIPLVCVYNIPPVRLWYTARAFMMYRPCVYNIQEYPVKSKLAWTRIFHKSDRFWTPNSVSKSFRPRLAVFFSSRTDSDRPNCWTTRGITVPPVRLWCASCAFMIYLLCVCDVPPLC